MGLNRAPNRNQAIIPFIDDHGFLMPGARRVIDEFWRHVAAGLVVVPCNASGINLITLMPALTGEGAKLYATGMMFSFKAAATSTGAVTAVVTDGATPLATVKVYTNPGITQAAAGDIVVNGIYLLIYNATLNGGAGGLVLK